MSTSYEDFTILNGYEKGTLLLDELAYRLYQKTKGANVEELEKITPSIAAISGILIGLETDKCTPIFNMEGIKWL